MWIAGVYIEEDLKSKKFVEQERVCERTRRRVSEIGRRKERGLGRQRRKEGATKI
jgi:hypothetical protein